MVGLVFLQQQADCVHVVWAQFEINSDQIASEILSSTQIHFLKTI